LEDLFSEKNGIYISEEKEVFFLMDNMLLIYEVKDERKNTTENLTAGTNMEPKDSVLWVDVFPDPRGLNFPANLLLTTVFFRASWPLMGI